MHSPQRYTCRNGGLSLRCRFRRVCRIACSAFSHVGQLPDLALEQGGAPQSGLRGSLMDYRASRAFHGSLYAFDRAGRELLGQLVMFVRCHKILLRFEFVLML